MAKLVVVDLTLGIVVEDDVQSIPVESFETFAASSSNIFQEARFISKDVPTDAQLASLYAILAPGGKLRIEKCMPTRESGQSVVVECKVSGFVDVMAIKGFVLRMSYCL